MTPLDEDLVVLSPFSMDDNHVSSIVKEEDDRMVALFMIKTECDLMLVPSLVSMASDETAPTSGVKVENDMTVAQLIAGTTSDHTLCLPIVPGEKDFVKVEACQAEYARSLSIPIVTEEEQVVSIPMVKVEASQAEYDHALSLPIVPEGEKVVSISMVKVEDGEAVAPPLGDVEDATTMAPLLERIKKEYVEGDSDPSIPSETSVWPHCVSIMSDHSTELQDKPFTCKVCSKGFEHTFLLRRHLVIHTGEQVYKCDFCSKSFSNRRARGAHQKIHVHPQIRSHAREYKCDICSKTFNDRRNLTKHLRIHSGKRHTNATYVRNPSVGIQH
jgi:hypothetical protein